ncbi:MAG: hypothetical protein AcusKO_14460 [Acuticoccus sp.]
MDLPAYVGRYAVRHKIARGGFALVALAWDEELDSPVAIKILDTSDRDGAEGERLRHRFLEEARLLRRIRSHHVVTVHDVGRLGDGRPYFVMDFADGGTLADYLNDKWQETPGAAARAGTRELVAAAEGIADGLAAIHRAGVVHRDIKPANILFLGHVAALRDPDATMVEPAAAGPLALPDGDAFDHARVVVGDLGIAMDVARRGATPTEVGGTSAYSAPEQLDPAEPVSPAADIYSATAVLYHLLIGAKPPRPDRLVDHINTLPERWREVMRCGLAFDPGDRFGTIRSWHAAVEDVLTEEAAEAAPPAPVAMIDRAGGPVYSGCPYKGLGSYQVEDADNFYGREALTEELVRRMQLHNVLVVGGPSGSGKSSLVRAGLIPALKAGAAGGSSRWRTILMTPGRDAMAELYFGLAHSLEGAAPIIGASDLMASPSLARRLAHPTGTEPPLVVCIDQFEELFTLNPPGQREAFVDALAAMTDPADSRVRVVIAVRADYYAACAQVPWLAARTTENQVLVGPMSPAELRRAVTEPARNGELYLERHLVDAILETAGDEAGSLPLVAHALVETFKRRKGQTLTLEGFRAAGGVAGAIAQTANTIFEEQFGESERAATHRLFLRLVTPGEGAGDTRRILDRAELKADPEPEVTERVVAQLTDARLLTVNEDTVQIAHEALLRSWPRLRAWIDDARDDLRMRQRLIQYAQEWGASGRDGDLLLRGTPLFAALDFLRKNPEQGATPAGTFIEASKARQSAAEEEARKRRRRSRRLRIAAVSVLSVLAVGATTASVFAWLGYRDAARNEVRAEAATREANARFALALGAVGAGLAEDDPLLALYLGAEAVARAGSAPGYDGRAAMVAARQALAGGRPYVVGSPIPVGDALSLAISPDGAFLAVGDRGGTITIYDSRTRNPVGTQMARHRGGIEHLTFSPDGRALISAGSDGSVLRWPVSDGFLGESEPIAQFGDVAWAVDFDRDGKRLAMVSEDQSVRLFDVERGTEIGPPLMQGGGDPLSVTFGPGGESLLTGFGSGRIRSFQLPGGEPFAPDIDDVHTSDVWTLTFPPDGKKFASVSADGTAALFAYPEMAFLRRAFPEDTRVASATFTPDGGALIGGDESGRLNTLRMAGKARAEQSAVGHTGRILEVVTPHAGTLAATLGRDQSVRLWRVFDKVPLTRDVTLPGGAAKGLAAGPDGTYAAADISGEIAVWRAGVTEPLRLAGHDAQVWALALSPDGQRLASGDRSGTVRLWDLATGAALWTAQYGGGAVWSLAFAADGTRLVMAADGEVALLDTADGTVRGEYRPPAGMVTRATVSPRGERLAVTTTAGRVALLSLPTLAPEQELAVVDDIAWSAAFSPDGRLLAIGASDEVVSIWDIASGLRIADLAGHSGGATDIAFLTGGVTLAAVDRRGQLHLWDVADYRRFGAPMPAHAGASWRLAAAPGNVFFTAGDDGLVRRWDVMNVGRACAIGATGFDRARRAAYFGKEAGALACESGTAAVSG